MANKPSPRLKRELKTIDSMLKIYCRNHHKTGEEPLCRECQDLLEYAEKRLARCPFGRNKPTCGNCTIHCYQPEKRKKVKEVMRYSGPRMITRHPILALMHLADGYKTVAKPPVTSGASAKKNCGEL
ncbi:nitrous oxide-stimulated promoter family protein [Desulforhopalus singaporensis]|uniref:Nitrous oxide-stimulated promoter n=1 Tax=Desulforhopalus singaporensis TaxID=91360 RepID=A0A1H0PCA7_9BACT|nr:nitrous oxide-stimulated promoter family protein [Desulforhopalus singaporensis]SDP02643.1 Nitrous oxide-stimulated promoter [Desulforhopalus singaporensis]